LSRTLIASAAPPSKVARVFAVGQQRATSFVVQAEAIDQWASERWCRLVTVMTRRAGGDYEGLSSHDGVTRWRKVC